MAKRIERRLKKQTHSLYQNRKSTKKQAEQPKTAKYVKPNAGPARPQEEV